MLRVGILALIVVCACAPETRPEVVRVSIEEGERWLHDPVLVEFSEPIDLSTLVDGIELITGAGESIPTSIVVAASDSPRLLLQVDYAAAASGTLSLVVTDEIRDRDGDRLVPATFEWELGEWTRHRFPIGVDEIVSDPVVLAQSGPYLWLDAIVILWIVEDSGGRRLTGVWRIRDEWRPIEAFEEFGDASIVAAAGPGGYRVLHADQRSIVDLSEGWWSTPSQDIGLLGATSLASSRSGGHVVAGTVDGTSVRVALGEDGWALTGGAPLAATGLLGSPVVALPDSKLPVVSFIDDLEGSALLRTLRFGGLVWAEWESLRIDGVADLSSIVANDDVTHVAWTEPVGDTTRIAIGEIMADRVTVLPAVGSDNASAPSLTIGFDAQLHVSWVEGEEGSASGRIARWSGVQWEPIGGPFTDTSPALGASTALYADLVPVAAWRDEDSIVIALYNGPSAD